MKKLKILELILWALSAFLIITWYDWKLLLILVVFGWANNLMKSNQKRSVIKNNKNLKK